eukprot:COSAG01_NODE_643_length_14566_cov_31.994194_2_plen_134_part_00
MVRTMILGAAILSRTMILGRSRPPPGLADTADRMVWLVWLVWLVHGLHARWDLSDAICSILACKLHRCKSVLFEYLLIDAICSMQAAASSMNQATVVLREPNLVRNLNRVIDVAVWRRLAERREAAGDRKQIN